MQAGSFLPRVVVLYQGGSVGYILVLFVVCTMLFSQGLFAGWVVSWSGLVRVVSG